MPSSNCPDCQDRRGTEVCDTCGELFCVDCIENHEEHCERKHD